MKPKEFSFEKVKKSIEETKDIIIKDIDTAYDAYDIELGQKSLNHLMSLSAVHKSVLSLSDLEMHTDMVPTYWIDHFFLRDCLNFMDDGKDEMMLFVTGTHMTNVRVLSKIVPFKHASRSPVYAKGDITSAATSLIGLDEHGYQLHAWFHTHPGKGHGATHPSGIDIDHQTALEQAGYPAIGGIFTRDGCVRFFSCGFKFAVEAHGSRIEQIDELTYKFEV